MIIHRDLNLVAAMEKMKLNSIKQIIAVASGKGGVGKSTVSVNLAVALHTLGCKVGLLDADIYGPSQALMLGGRNVRAESSDGKTVEPVMKHGIASMSIAYLMPEDKAPAIWRGPMVSGALQQLLRDTQWGELDYLIIDLPPGTGDIQLTMAQKIPVTGAVVVTTPQDVALIDARKAIEMLRKVNIPVFGIVENMSIHACEKCGHETHIFGHEGGVGLAKEYVVDLLGPIPLARAIREQADQGVPSVVSDPKGPYARCFLAIAQKIIERSHLPDLKNSRTFPHIDIDA
ncbi:MAG: iron-sulfur cluster carrier protein ApbC [Gammaproteobacteria bacterium]|nr:iron-sulfur cluster carrier protein ApbC [Gammaproteobacteria bacterium]